MYTLTLSKEQAEVVSRATEFLARVQMGQLEDVYYQLLDGQKLKDLHRTQQQTVRQLLADAALIITGHRGATLGIHTEAVPDSARTAWDIYQVVRHVLAWERQPEGGIQVSFDEPRSVNNKPLATMEKVETVNNPEKKCCKTCFYWSGCKIQSDDKKSRGECTIHPPQYAYEREKYTQSDQFCEKWKEDTE